MGRVAFDGVTKRFGKVTAVDDLSLEAADQELLVLLGPSGCGKTTVLRLLAGLEDPTEGTVVVGDQVVNDIAAIDRDVAMVFQTYALYPHMTVRRNIEFPLRSRKVPAPRRRELLAQAATALGLEDLLDRKPAQLSGGQRQRVALARAMVRRPQVFLMDEPLSNLDATLRVQARAELVELQRRLGTTVVYVTHDQVEAMTMAHRIAVMDHGALQQVGAPQDVYAAPANLFVARFVGNPPMNTLPGTVVAAEQPGDPDALAVEVGGRRPLALSAGQSKALRARGSDQVVVGFRPEHAELDGHGPLDATVAVVEVLGHEQHVFCRLADGSLVAVRRSEAEAPRAIGSALRVGAPASRLHLFDAGTGGRIEA